MDEGSIGAVLEHAAHEIGEKIGEAAYWRVHAHVELVLDKERVVQRVAHADKLLELINPPALRATPLIRGAKLEDGRHRAAVVRGEGGIDGLRRFEQSGGAGDVRNIGSGLAREYRVVGHAELLGALDFAVPIGA